MLKCILPAVCCVALGSLPAAAADPEVVKFGIVDSLVEDISKGQRDFLVSEFNKLIEDFTLVKSAVALGGDPLSAGRQLESGQWHLGIYQGVEFARAQARYPKLQPLMIATYKQPKLQALLVARKDGKLTGFADLKGKNVGLLASREHCRLFADKGAEGKAGDFFGKLTKTRNVEEALDDVLGGKLDAAIMDNITLKTYEDIHPGRFARLKILAESEIFPAAVIAYQAGALSDATLTRLRDGMLRANKSEKGREVMESFRISNFEAVPADYQQTLTNILKAYPMAK